ncbi:2-deoxyribose-5-phosphate aldolase, partial [Staphylococcus felis]
KVKASELSKAAGAHFVKTSTGFAGGGATPEDVKLMKDTVGDALEVKASGGVRNLDDFKAMLHAGATRVGASAGVQIMQGLEADTDY